MSLSLSIRTRRRSSAGMTLLEAVLAVLLLSVCLVPAANALHAAIAAPRENEAAARDLDCVSSRMETVLAEPYGRLLAKAGNLATPSAYSTPEGDGCPAVSVFITRYGNDKTARLGATGNGEHLLYVGAELAAAGAANRFPLVTLVTR